MGAGAPCGDTASPQGDGGVYLNFGICKSIKYSLEFF